MKSIYKKVLVTAVACILCVVCCSCSSDTDTKVGLGEAPAQSPEENVDTVDGVTDEKETSVQDYTLGDMHFQIPESWETKPEKTDSTGVAFDTKYSGLCVAMYYKDGMKSYGNVDDAFEKQCELFSSYFTMGLPEDIEMGDALAKRYGMICTDSDGVELKGYHEIILSGNDIYVISVACAFDERDEHGEEISSVVNSISGLDEEPITGKVTIDPDSPLMMNLFKGISNFEPSTFTGSGDDVVTLETNQQPALLKVNYTGSGNFAIILYDADGNSLDLLINEIGPYEGTVTTFFDSDKAAILEIKASGEWTIQCLPYTYCQQAENGATFHGDNVVFIDAKSISKLHFAHDGESNFVVRSFDGEFDLLVNEIGQYSGTVVWTEPDAVFFVNADGNWSISW